MSNNNTIYFNSNASSRYMEKPDFSSINAGSNGDTTQRRAKRRLDFSEPLFGTKKRTLSDTDSQIENQENIPKSAITTHNLAPEIIKQSNQLIAPIWYQKKLQNHWGVDVTDQTKVIAKGGFGRVLLSNITGCNGLPLVVKLQSPYKSKNPETRTQLAENELDILKFLKQENGPHIVRQHGYLSISGTKFAFLMENGGESLYSIYLDPKNPDKKTIDWPTLQNIAQQSLTGLAYLDMKGIAHNDLKPQNIGYFNDYVTIFDFGLAQFTAGTSKYPGGTPIYRAPETFSILYPGLDPAQKPKVDIWGLACILFELLTQKRFASVPKEAPNRILELFYAIKSRLNLTEFPKQINEHDDFFSSPGVLKASSLPPLPKLADAIRSIENSPKAEEFIDLLNQMLVWNPIMRQSAAELLTHPFLFNEYVKLMPDESSSPDQLNDTPVSLSCFLSKKFGWTTNSPDQLNVKLMPDESFSPDQLNIKPAPSAVLHEESSSEPQKLATGEVEYSAGYFLN